MATYTYLGGLLTLATSWGPQPNLLVPGPADSVKFPNGVNVTGGPLTVSTAEFSAACTFSGTLSAGSVIVDAGVALTIAVGATLTESSGLTVNGTVNQPVVGGVGGADNVTGTFQLNNAASVYQLDGGKLTVTNPNSAAEFLAKGTFNQTGGTNQINGPFEETTAIYNLSGGVLNGKAEYIGEHGVSTFTQTGGVNNASDRVVLGIAVDFNSPNAPQGIPGTGTYTLGGNAATILNVQTIYDGSDPLCVGVFNYDTKAGDAAQLNIAGTGVDPGLIVGGQGTGTFFQGGGNIALIAGNGSQNIALQVGRKVGGVGTYNLNAGNLSTGVGISEVVGDAGTGTFNQNLAPGGTNTVGGALIIGNQSGSIGTYKLDGAAANVLTAKTIDIGGASSGATTAMGTFNYDVTGGNAVLKILAVAPVTATALTVGDAGIGVLNQGGGAINLSADLVVGAQLSGNGTYMFNKGQLATALADETIGDIGIGKFVQNNLAGGAVNNVRGNLGVGGNLIIGNQNGSDGTYTLGGAASNSLTADNITIGAQHGSTGVLNFDLLAADAATITITDQLTVGAEGNGTLNQGIGPAAAIALSNDLEVGSLAGGTGTYNLNAGSLATDPGFDEIIGDEGTGVFNQSNLSAGATNTVGVFGTLIIGNQAGGDGTYTLGGNAANTLIVDTITLGAESGSTGIFNFDTASGDDGQFNVTAAGGTTGLTVGAAGDGTFNQGDGDVTLTANAGNSGTWDLSVGSLQNGNGTYNLSGGTLNAAYAVIGDQGRGSFTQSGGDAIFGVTGASASAQGTTLSIGSQLTGNGTYHLSADTLTVTGNAIIGDQGRGSILQTTGTQTTDTATFAGTFILGNATTGIGTYDLSGTTFSVAKAAIIGNQGNGTFTQIAGTATFNMGMDLAALASAASAPPPPSAGFYNLLGGLLLSNQPAIIGDTGIGTFTQTGGTARFLAGQNQAALIIGGDPNANPGAGVGRGTGIYTLGSSNAPAKLVVESTNPSNIGDGIVEIGVNGGTGTFNFNTALGDQATVQNAGAAQNQANTLGPIFQIGVNGGTGTLNQGGGTLTASDIQIATNVGSGNVTQGSVTVSGASATLVTANMEVGSTQPNGLTLTGGVANLEIKSGALVEVDQALAKANIATVLNFLDVAQIDSNGVETFRGGISINSGGRLEVGGNSGAPANTLQIDSGSSLVGHGLIDSDVTGQLQIGNTAQTNIYSLTVNDNGMIEAAQNGVLVIHGAFTGSGTAQIDANATLEITGAFGAQNHLNFNGTGATLILDNVAAFKGQIQGIQVGDRIDLKDTSVANGDAVVSATIVTLGGTQTLQILEGTSVSHVTQTLDIALSNPVANLAQCNFSITQAANGADTYIYLSQNAVPAVTAVVISPANGNLTTGGTATFTLDFNEGVNVTGIPTLSLNDGGTATYVSGSGTGALTFSYTVGPHDLSAASLTATALGLNGGSIVDSGGNHANLTLGGVVPSGPEITNAAPAPATVTQEIAGLYVTLYGLAATQAGINFWTNTASAFDASITAANAGSTPISVTDEVYLGQQMTAGSPVVNGTTYFQTLYPSTITDSAYVQALYQNMSGFIGTTAGDQFWLSVLQQTEASNGGNVTLAREAIVGQFVHDFYSNNLTVGATALGVSASDYALLVAGQQTLQNKVTVAQYWATETDFSGGAILNFTHVTDASFAAAQHVLLGIKSDPSTVTVAITGINNAVAHQDLSLV